MRKFTQRKKKLNLTTHNKRNKFGILVICLVLIVLISSFLVFRSGFLNIQNIEISLDKNITCVNEEQIQDSYGIVGHNILLINSVSSEKSIKEKFLCVKDIVFIKSFPNKIKVDVSGREPVIVLMVLKSKEATSSGLLENLATPSAELSSDAFLIDKEAVIYSKNIDNLNLPQIFFYDTNLFLGKRLEENLGKNSLKILSKLKEFGIDVKTAMISNNALIIFSVPKIILGLDDIVDTQIASLQLILEKAKIDSSQVEFIDLRFDKPVIRIAPKSR